MSLRHQLLTSIYSLDFIDDQEIQLHHLGVVSSVNAWDPITEEAVLQALDLILNPTNYPMMIMCNLGRHRTGKNKDSSLLTEINTL
jgi:extradiol dioxygenase family protein